MSWNNKVVWSEGMFLRPQHFQQHIRYVENLVESRCSALRPYSWGFTELKLDQKMLSMGKLSIASASGVFPDGTPFNIPHDDDPPTPLNITEDIHDSMVYLSLPTRRYGVVQVDESSEREVLARYTPREYEVWDTSRGAEYLAPVQVGVLRTRLMSDKDIRDDYTCMGVARVVEAKVDQSVVLNDAYIPSVLDCQAAPGLAGFIKELLGLLQHRGEALAGRVSASGRGGAAEIADFLMLQLVNRYMPVMNHLTRLRGLHPESFYRLALELAGELATFTREEKRPGEYPVYRHEELQSCFIPLMRELRQSLSTVLEQNAVPIPLEIRKYGIRVAPINDRNLLDSASFVLAVSADIPTDELLRHFPAQVKIGPVEKIRELVNVQLPGIKVRPLPVAPRQIPYHSGFVYFELDRTSEFWKQLKESGGFAMHMGGDFPGLEMEFWAIKG